MFTLNCKGRLLQVDKPIVMGIINITPDSFFSESRHQQISVILKKAEEMLKHGASIIDIGGQSTRPGSERINVDEELQRVIEPIIAINKAFPDAIISIDTYAAKIAMEAVAAGASLVNDISAGNMDKTLLQTVGKLNVPYVLMHMQGTPETMQQQTFYNDLSKNILDFFISKIQEAETCGIKDIIIDPGFGFGKTIPQNFELLHSLGVYKMLGKPILVGLSRKSTIYKTLNISPNDSLNGSTVLHTISLLNGANILRVHDVKEAVEAIQLFNAYTDCAK